MCQDTVLMVIPNWAEASRYKDGLFIDNQEFGLNEKGQKCFKIDACIAPIIQMLWMANVHTIGCCCGHDAGPAVISFILKDTFYDSSIPHHCTKCGLLHTEPEYIPLDFKQEYQ